MRGGRAMAAAIWAAAVVLGAAARGGDYVRFEPATTEAGYLARLLVNESPFPGERGYLSEFDTKATMLSVLWVLHSRMHHVPEGYTQEQIASVRASNVVELITAKNQCEGFYRDAEGKPAFAARVEDRIRNLERIANGGGKPGRFAGLLNFGQNLASAYCAGGIAGADRFAGLEVVGRIPVTGRAYAWMTDMDCYNPGGNFVSIPDGLQGGLGGNRFYTLRKEPR